MLTMLVESPGVLIIIEVIIILFALASALGNTSVEEENKSLVVVIHALFIVVDIAALLLGTWDYWLQRNFSSMAILYGVFIIGTIINYLMIDKNVKKQKS